MRSVVAIVVVAGGLSVGLVACNGDDGTSSSGGSADGSGEPTSSVEPSESGAADSSTAGSSTTGDVGATSDTGDSPSAGTGSTGSGTATGSSVPANGTARAPQRPCPPPGRRDEAIGVVGGTAVALLTDVTVDSDACGDVVTFVFDGATLAEQQPAFRVSVAEPPFTTDGEGRQVEVAGSSWIGVHIEGASGVDLSVDPFVETYTGPDEIVPDGSRYTATVRELGDFEAVLSWVIGLDADRGFTVAWLENPVRLQITIG